jgi:hypothetical protein
VTLGNDDAGRELAAVRGKRDARADVAERLAVLADEAQIAAVLTGVGSG